MPEYLAWGPDHKEWSINIYAQTNDDHAVIDQCDSVRFELFPVLRTYMSLEI